VEKEGIGKAVRMGSSSDWVAAVNGVIHDMDVLKAMQIRCKHAMEEKFNSDGYAEKLEEVFTSVLRSSQKSIQLPSAVLK